MMHHRKRLLSSLHSFNATIRMTREHYNLFKPMLSKFLSTRIISCLFKVYLTVSTKLGVSSLNILAHLIA